MNLLLVVFLGIVQGLTEFLPVSSSGHLVILQNLIPNFSQPGVLFDVFLHFGTLFSVLFYFRKHLIKYLNFRYLSLLFIATIPVVIVGFLFKSQIEALFQSVKIVGGALIITGVLNLLTDKLKTKKGDILGRNALLTGVAQAVAIVPGISRSGSTIFASVAQGIDKKRAAEFSFVLSIPAILGANLLEIIDNYHKLNGMTNFYLIGFITSFIVGVIAIKLTFKFLSTNGFKYLAYYCFVVGFIALLL